MSSRKALADVARDKLAPRLASQQPPGTVSMARGQAAPRLPLEGVVQYLNNYEHGTIWPDTLTENDKGFNREVKPAHTAAGGAQAMAHDKQHRLSHCLRGYYMLALQGTKVNVTDLAAEGVDIIYYALSTTPSAHSSKWLQPEEAYAQAKSIRRKLRALRKILDKDDYARAHLWLVAEWLPDLWDECRPTSAQPVPSIRERMERATEQLMVEVGAAAMLAGVGAGGGEEQKEEEEQEEDWEEFKKDPWLQRIQADNAYTDEQLREFFWYG